MTRERFQELVWDYLYDLLESHGADSRADFESLLLTDEECRALLAKARTQKALLATAARQAAPADFRAPFNRTEPRRAAATVDYASRGGVYRWALAAGVIFVLLLGGAGPLFLKDRELSDKAALADAQLRELEQKYAAVKPQYERILQARADAERELRQVNFKLGQETARLREKAREEGFYLTVARPAIYEAGAPYTLLVNARNLKDQPIPVELAVNVYAASSAAKTTTDSLAPAATALARAVPTERILTREAQPGVYEVSLPPDLDPKQHPELTVEIIARNAQGLSEKVAERLKLFSSFFVTHVTTDKPMYEPGQTVYFRSLTLERFSLKPAEELLNLHYLLTDGKGQKVYEQQGRAEVLDQQGRPILGPDGKPVRGLGCGAFTLPADAAGGEYALTVSELSGRFPPEQRKFIVNAYEKPRLKKELEWTRKSYGPGAEAVAACKVAAAEGGGPIADQPVQVTINIDGQTYGIDGLPSQQPIHLKTDDQGRVNVRFKLPAELDKGIASLAVQFTDGANHETLVRPIPIVLSKFYVDFFPEGGDLVTGTPNRVYFHVRTTHDKPAELKGRLIDDTGQEAATLETFADDKEPGANHGVGAFTFTPQVGKKYTLKVDAPAGATPIWTMPAVKEQGLVLSINEGVGQAGQPIHVSLQNVGPARNLLIGAYCRGRTVDQRALRLGANETAALDLKSLSVGGVYRVTVFEERATDQQRLLTPLAERLIYRAPAQRLELKLSTLRQSYIPGERATLRAEALTERGEPAPSILMLLVRDQNVTTLADEKTARAMPTHFLLTSEIRKPEDLEHTDFLLTDHPKAAIVLDLLLGTQGWRRFAEQDPEQFKKSAAEDALQLLARAGLEQTPEVETTYAAAAARMEERLQDAVAQAARPLAAARGKALQQQETATRELEEFKNTPTFQLVATYLAQLANVKGQLTEAERKLAAFRTELLPYAAAFLIGLAVLGFIIWHGPRRRPVFFATGIAICACFLLVVVGLAYLTQSPSAKFANVGAAAFELPEIRDLNLGTPPAFGLRGGVAGEELKFAAPRSTKAGGDGPGAAMPEVGVHGESAGAPRNRAVDALPAPAKPATAEPLDAAKGGNDPRALFLGDEGAKERLENRLADEDRTKPRPPTEGRVDLNQRREKERLIENAERAAGKKVLPASPAEEKDKANVGRGVLGKALASPPVPGAPAGQLGPRGAAPLAGDDGKPSRARIAGGGGGPGFGPEPAAEAGARVIVIKPDNTLEEVVRRQLLPSLDPLIVREYAHERSKGVVEVRNDFVETLLWQPIVVLAKGSGTVSFDLCDSITTFEAIAYGHTADGRLGAGKFTFESKLPFSVEPKIPTEITATDEIEVPVAVTNGMEAAQKVKVGIVNPKNLAIAGPTEARLDIAANARARARFRVKALTLEGEARLELEGRGDGGVSDTMQRTIRIVPDGFPIVESRSGQLEQMAAHEIELPPSWIKGSLRLHAAAYPSTLADLQKGLESLLREPSGCFEQTSSSSYPNTLILSYLDETKQSRPEIERKARNLLDRGYQKLVGFECLDPQNNRRGYEWFGGRAAPHEALTAYGLLQFTDMAKLYPVDAGMLKRTLDYLLSQRDGQGGFKRNPRGLDHFGRAPDAITNAYIVWSLTEAGTKEDLTAELMALKAATEKANDPYLLALVANSLLNVGQVNEAHERLKKLVDMQAAEGYLNGKETSITGSGGRELQIETTALALLAWLKVDPPGEFLSATNKAIKWLTSQRGGYGGFGSTQSTILALKALIAYAKKNARPIEDGDFILWANGEELARASFTSQAQDAIEIRFDNGDRMLKAGKNRLGVLLTGKNSFPYSLRWTYQAIKPASDAGCPVKLETKLDKVNATEGDAVRMTVKVNNVSGKGQGMAVAIIGIPAGLTLPEDMKQLKDYARLQDDDTRPGLISAWETRGRELILYWRDLAPDAEITLPVDLVARVPGKYRGPASRAYLYYNADAKHWIEPLAVEITGK